MVTRSGKDRHGDSPAAAFREEPKAKTPNKSAQQSGTKKKGSSAGNGSGAKKQKAKRVRKSWDHRYEEMKKFKEENGHCDVPIRYKPNPTLGKFGNNQREQHKTYVEMRIATGDDDEAFAAAMKEKKCPMTEERVCLLEAIGFNWSIDREKVFDARWDKKFSALLKFRAENRHCRVTPKDEDKYPGLPEWVHRQRSLYYEMQKRKEEGRTLASERKRDFGDRDPDNVIKARMNRLIGIGFALHVRSEVWDGRIEELKEYKAKKGNTLVPREYVRSPGLGRWVHAQRVLYQKIKKGEAVGGLSAERIKVLDDIGFNWAPKESTVAAGSKAAVPNKRSSRSTPGTGQRAAKKTVTNTLSSTSDNRPAVLPVATRRFGRAKPVRSLEPGQKRIRGGAAGTKKKRMKRKPQPLGVYDGRE